MLDVSNLKDLNLFTNKQYNKILIILSKSNEKFGFNLYKINNYLNDYQREFYKKNENKFVNIKVNDIDKQSLFYPFHRVHVSIMSLLLINVLLSEFKYNIENLDTKSLETNINNLTSNNLKQIEEELIGNEVKLILKIFNSKLKDCNYNEKIKLIDNYIEILQHLIHEQINLKFDLDIKCNYPNDVFEFNKDSKYLELLNDCYNSFDNLLSLGLIKVIVNLEKQKKQVIKIQNKLIIDSNTNSQLQDQKKIELKEKLQNIETNRQLVIVIMLASYNALNETIQKMQGEKKTHKINQSKLIENILYYFEYSGEISNVKHEVQNFDIELVDKSSILKKEDKLLCSDLENYITNNQHIFTKMIKLRKIVMSKK